MKQILPVAVFAMSALTGCVNKTEMNAGIRMENLDTTAVRGADFYQYACGGWMSTFFNFVLTNAAPFPGFTCKNSTTDQRPLSMSSVKPVFKSFTEIIKIFLLSNLQS